MWTVLMPVMRGVHPSRHMMACELSQYGSLLVPSVSQGHAPESGPRGAGPCESMTSRLGVLGNFGHSGESWLGEIVRSGLLCLVIKVGKDLNLQDTRS